MDATVDADPFRSPAPPAAGRGGTSGTAGGAAAGASSDDRSASSSGRGSRLPGFSAPLAFQSMSTAAAPQAGDDGSQSQYAELLAGSLGLERLTDAAIEARMETATRLLLRRHVEAKMQVRIRRCWGTGVGTGPTTGAAPLN